MSLNILLVTDAFPPTAGGSGWSTYELARGLRARGDRVLIVRPRPGGRRGMRIVEDAYDGFTVHELGTPSPRTPFVRNYVKNERLAPRLASALRDVIRRERIDIVHGQHLLSTPGAIAAARAEGLPCVATVRDYWPVCYWSDLIHDRLAPDLCPACSAGMMTRCIRPHGGAAWPAALPMIPYMRSNLAWKRRTLARADAIVAVSSTIARDLRARAPELANARIDVIPNPLDLSVLDAAAASDPPDLPRPYAIYVGKLAPNKGVRHLIPAVRRAGLRWPLVIAGDGPERGAVEQAARAAGIDVRFTGWTPRDEALRLLAHAALLVFPSHGPESLSRVLLESGGLGVPAAAMDTGGTRDIIVHGETGLLSTSPEALGDDVRRLVEDEELRTRLGAGARAHVRSRFASQVVVQRMADLYDDLLSTPRRLDRRHA